MKLIRNLFSISLVVLTLSACSNDEKISYNRGKVKFETISISGKLAGRVSKIYIKKDNL